MGKQAMGFLGEFKKFIARGNVLDLAVGVIIGAAFGKIVTSLTEAIIMPFIGWLFGALDFSNWFIRLGSLPEGYNGAPNDYAALKAAGATMIGYGDLLTQLVNFLIVAFALFLLIRTVNKLLDEMHAKQKADAATAETPVDPQLELLKEIRDELRKRPG
jgi:large conductance mechanosensitive channel